jgi:hypothetical protein
MNGSRLHRVGQLLQDLRKCHTTCVVFEARSSALAPFLALKRYYKPHLMCQLRKSCIGKNRVSWSAIKQIPSFPTTETRFLSQDFKYF